MTDDLDFPPWDPVGAETPAVNSQAFANCEIAVDALATRTAGRVIDRCYTESPKWGRILRARIATTHAGKPSGIDMITWTGPAAGPDVRFATRLDAPPW
ncbi:MAG TPA: hypothetical protein VHW60_18700 [Caulobacteraceae bacterium]|jgi:hypothetical protein|nr:hypothetical protein [Caulobacteraceae bacterium]